MPYSFAPQVATYAPACYSAPAYDACYSSCYSAPVVYDACYSAPIMDSCYSTPIYDSCYSSACYSAVDYCAPRKKCGLFGGLFGKHKRRNACYDRGDQDRTRDAAHQFTIRQARCRHQRAIGDKFAHLHALHELGTILLEADRAEDAAVAFRRTVRFDPASSAAWEGLGNALAETGDLEGAADCWRRAERVISDGESAEALKRKLEGLTSRKRPARSSA